MREDIIDQFEKEKIDKPTSLKHYSVLVLLYFSGLYIISTLKLFLPKYIIEYENISMLTSNFLALIYVIVIPKILITGLNNRSPTQRIAKLILATFLIILVGDFLYRNYQLYNISEGFRKQITSNNYISTAIFIPFVSALIGSLLSWTRILKLRNKSLMVPYIAIVLSVVVFSYIIISNGIK